MSKLIRVIVVGAVLVASALTEFALRASGSTSAATSGNGTHLVYDPDRIWRPLSGQFSPFNPQGFRGATGPDAGSELFAVRGSPIAMGLWRPILRGLLPYRLDTNTLARVENEEGWILGCEELSSRTSLERIPFL